jgi:hypothetical protein
MTELFAGQGWPAEGEELLRRSLRPRGPELLLEAPGWLGLGVGHLGLEAGCRDATHAIALARRYGCRVLGVDLVWCRDVLSCVEDAGRVLGECALVVRPGGGMVLYAVFATDQLAPADRALLVEGLGNSPASMDQPTVEAAIAAAGFQVVRRERITSEWSEHQLERDPGYLTEDLLEIARLTRNRDRAEATVGLVWYRRALAFASWGLQIVLGRLVPVLYALGKPVTGGPASPQSPNSTPFTR